MFWSDTEVQGAIEVRSLESEVLEGNPLDDPSRRDLHLYLPPSYDRSDRSYPVIYCLAGFAGRGKKYLKDSTFMPGIHHQFESLIEDDRAREAIIVFPDCMTSYGGSQYLNSSATGPYEAYLTEEIVPFVDREFRTRPAPDQRAVMGKSSGGYGALRLGMKHPDLFGLVLSHSGDMMFRYCYMPDFPKAISTLQEANSPEEWLQSFFEKDVKGKHEFPVFNIIGMAACYSPDPEEPGSFLLPFDLDTGEFREGIWEQWQEHDPVNMVDSYEEALKELSYLYFDCGTSDEFNLHIGARRLSQKLDEKGVSHTYEEFDGGHMKTRHRYPVHLEKLTNQFS